MKPWLKRTLFGLVGAGVLFGGLAACSHRPHGWHGASAEDAARFQSRAVDWATRELKLDETQKQQLVALADRLRAQRDTLRGPDADPRAQINALVAGPRFERAQAKALVESKAQAVTQASPALIDAFGDFYDGLRPEQQAKLRELMTRRGHHGWRG